MSRSEDEIVHYGVKGMKWGVRKGGNRVRGALSDQNQRATAVLTRARENRAKGLNEKINRGTAIALSGGTKRFNRKVDKALGRLGAQKERLENGKLATRDVLQAVSGLSLLELGVSIQDRRG